MAAPNETQILQLISLLGVSPVGKFFRIDELGLNSTQITAYSGLSAAAAIRSVVAALTVEQQNLTSSLIDQYNAMLPGKGVSIQHGSVGGITGLNVNIDEMLETIKIQIRALVPFVNQWSQLPVGQVKTNGSNFVGVSV